jgi:hypothetical protein
VFRRVIAPAAAAALLVPASGLAAKRPPKKPPATKPDPCPFGSLRALADVTGEVSKGIANLPESWSGAPEFFRFRWTCSGGTVEVRKSSSSGGGFDIRFPGNPGRYPVVNVVTARTYAASVSPNPDGSFHVVEAGNVAGDSFPVRSDAEFVIFVF